MAAEGKQAASMLSIATITPTFSVLQAEFPDYYHKVTGTKLTTEVHEKFESICKGTQILKRHFYTTPDMLESTPDLMTQSLGLKMRTMNEGVVSLGAKAAENAIAEWGQDRSKITHLVVATITGAELPGADYHLIKKLGLPLNVKRAMLYQQACAAGCTAVRIARDMAENNPGARVLVVCSVVISPTRFHKDEFSMEQLDEVVSSSLFGDGAAAVIMGSDPIPGVEKPIFTVHETAEVLFSNSLKVAEVYPSDSGLTVRLQKELPYLIQRNFGKIYAAGSKSAARLDLDDTPMHLSDGVFWAVHPGGPKILKGIERSLEGLPVSMDASWDVLHNFGNMPSASVLFVMHSLLKLSRERGCATSGLNHHWGMAIGFGPGVTVELLFLEAHPIA